MSGRAPRAARAPLAFPDNPFPAAGHVGDLVCLVLGAEEPPTPEVQRYRHWRADVVRRITGCLDAPAAPPGVTATLLARCVTAHALAHYEAGGWDWIAECWTPSAIATDLRRAGVADKAAAVAHFAAVAALMPRQEEALGSAGS